MVFAESENQAAFARHWDDLLSRFGHVVIVSLLDAGGNRSENVLSEALLHHLLLYNSPKLTCVLFDFHDYW
ncbi:Phosphatidylinositide phosphatase SAC2 [Fasciolopsis buskii]|uniref:Phosphatidylinositide phosphatase SAC2 n=1 Tax=Fasciolopsis buskii TaxID=27845 RepID=A0A8E0RQL1_9TREM|nr:Phosphatidylinositide phosphatase SAC2 [Fasciolopsis buski]